MEVLLRKSLTLGAVEVASKEGLNVVDGLASSKVLGEVGEVEEDEGEDFLPVRVPQSDIATKQTDEVLGQ